jgi:hypothetical protein
MRILSMVYPSTADSSDNDVSGLHTLVYCIAQVLGAYTEETTVETPSVWEPWNVDSSEKFHVGDKAILCLWKNGQLNSEIRLSEESSSW